MMHRFLLKHIPFFILNRLPFRLRQWIIVGRQPRLETHSAAFLLEPDQRTPEEKQRMQAFLAKFDCPVEFHVQTPCVTKPDQQVGLVIQNPDGSKAVEWLPRQRVSKIKYRKEKKN